MKEQPEFDLSLVGVVVVLQKVEDLNELADLLNQDCAEDHPVMVSLQGWTDAGSRGGLCRNPSVDNYEACLRQQCPYAGKCPILLQLKRSFRSYQGNKTSYGRLESFLSEWDGEEISVTQLREQLGISVAVWKDLMKDSDVKALMKKHGVVPVGRAANRKWTQSRDLCA